MDSEGFQPSDVPLSSYRHWAISTLEWLLLALKVCAGRTLVLAVLVGLPLCVVVGVMHPLGAAADATRLRSLLTDLSSRYAVGAVTLCALTPLVAVVLWARFRRRGFYYSITTRETHRLTDHLFPGTPIWRIFSDRIRASKSWERPRTPRFPLLLAHMALDLAVFLGTGALVVLLIR